MQRFSVPDPVGRLGGGAGVDDARFHPVSTGSEAAKTNRKGLSPWQSAACVCCGTAECIAATRRAAAIRR